MNTTVAKQCGLSNQKMFVMEYYLAKQENDEIVINQIIKRLSKLSNQELIEVYNKEVRTGLTGVNQQTILLYALSQVFQKRYYGGPIYVKNRKLRIGVEAKNWVTEIPEDPEEPFICNFQGITYIDTIKLDISFVSLIINVKSINQHFGSLQNFLRSNCRFGKTNGRLLVVSEMNDPPHWLISFTENILLPLGLREKTDYTFADEIRISDEDILRDSMLNQPHPCCVDIPWLESIITRRANYFWYV